MLGLSCQYDFIVACKPSYAERNYSPVGVLFFANKAASSRLVAAILFSKRMPLNQILRPSLSLGLPTERSGSSHCRLHAKIVDQVYKEHLGLGTDANIDCLHPTCKESGMVLHGLDDSMYHVQEEHGTRIRRLDSYSTMVTAELDLSLVDARLRVLEISGGPKAAGS